MNRNTLLVVVDVEVNRAILRALFENNYNILEAENGEQALLLLSQYKDSIAALLLDIIMPVKRRVQNAIELNLHREHLEDLPVSPRTLGRKGVSGRAEGRQHPHLCAGSGNRRRI